MQISKSTYQVIFSSPTSLQSKTTCPQRHLLDMADLRSASHRYRIRDGNTYSLLSSLHVCRCPPQRPHYANLQQIHRQKRRWHSNIYRKMAQNVDEAEPDEKGPQKERPIIKRPFILDETRKGEVPRIAIVIVTAFPQCHPPLP